MTATTAPRARAPGARRHARLLDAAALLAPVAFLFLLWSDSLRAWFIADDFAWLGLLPSIHSFQDFLHAMFAPMAQGTIRPWSERGFFILFERLFGLDPLPWRLCVFFTAAADAVLINRLARRLTGSRFAAFLAPVLWIANSALADALSWTCVYNELLCPLFLLGALLLFIRWLDTGDRRWWWWQLVVFTLGFGALEINIVYPAVAAAFLLLGDTGVQSGANASGRTKHFAVRSLAPLFAVSILYFLLHRLAAAVPRTGVYALHFDLRIFSTLALYWKWTVMPLNWPALRIGRHEAVAGIAFLSLALMAAIAAVWRCRGRMALFGPAWFLITLAPLLPLYDHRSYYYLTIPLIGLAITAAWGTALAWRNRPWRIAAACAVLAYCALMIPSSRIAARWWYSRYAPIRAMVLGVRQARENHPSKTIVLDGVTDDLYNDGIAHSAFRPVAAGDVYLTPESALSIHPAGDPSVLDSVLISAPTLRQLLADDSVVIYSISSGHLRNITRAYRRRVLGG